MSQDKKPRVIYLLETLIKDEINGVPVTMSVGVEDSLLVGGPYTGKFERVVRVEDYEAALDDNKTLRNVLSVQLDIIEQNNQLELENAKLKEKLRVAEGAHEKIAKVKYGLELSDYDNMEYVADYWAKQCGNYEGISREALRKIRGE